jgi:hypothetical protein
MAESAFKTMYREETVAAFEHGVSLLANTVVMEHQREGNTAIFLVAGTDGASAVTRGVNGLIPTRADDLDQNTCTLVEWHDKVRRTRFNIFGSQGDGRRIMQEGTVKVLNRKRDSDILTALATGTVQWNSGTAVTASTAVVMGAIAELGEAEVDIDEEDNMFGVISPKFWANMMQTTEFASGDYVEIKPFAGPAKKFYRWAGVNWIRHPKISGVGTASESCFIYHRNAIGHAIDMPGMDVDADYNREESYYWARTSVFMGSKLLQNTGVIEIVHNGA